MSNDLSGYGSRKWVTRDGTEMTWSQMTTSHLRKTAAFIRRAHSDNISAAYGTYSMIQGEQAEYMLEDQIISLEHQSTEVDALASEMERYAAYRERGAA